MTRHELHQKDMVITPLIFQGQSPYQIITNHPELDMSVRTLYSYLDNGILSARNIDLKRQVKFKPRKVHKTQIKDRSVFIGRMFSDFQSLGLDHFAEMDTVHSSQDSKRVILTFFLTREKLFLAFVMNRCSKGAVKLVFNKLEHQLGTKDFLLYSTQFLQIVALSLEIQNLLKTALMALCGQISTTATLCAAVKKAVLNRHTLCFG